jgi:hypothetical protein
MASRKAAQTGIITVDPKIMNVTRPPSFIMVGADNESDALSRLKIINAGATPKLTKSDRESSSFPMSEYESSNLEKNPSRKSKIIAASISHEAVTRSLFKVKIIAAKPEARLREVMKLGICFILMI